MKALSIDYAVGLPCTSHGPVGTKLGVFEHTLPGQWTGRHGQKTPEARGQKPPEGHRGDKQGIYFIGFFPAEGPRERYRYLSYFLRNNCLMSRLKKSSSGRPSGPTMNADVMYSE